MADLDLTDRKLISALKLDARASITTLAARLGVTRATCHARLNKLIESGVIQRFTIEVDSTAQGDVVRAVMMIALQGNLARTVTRVMRNMPEIVSLHSTNGAWDLVAQIETMNLAEFDRVLREVREISGVLNSETCLLLNTAKG